MSTLIITEKPSVAQSIASVLGVTKHEEGYLTGNEYIVSWCLGHLLELAPPHVYNEEYKQWKAEDLPIVPEVWQYEVVRKNGKQLNVLTRLMKSREVTEIVCATDAGREGELIFRLVYNYCSCKKPVKRLWISSLEESAILEGMKALKDSSAYDSLYEAALCRQKADWLVGMNASRLFSLMYGTTMNVGRVMTPTLKMIVDRENAIASFRQEHFYTVQLRSGVEAVSERFSDKVEAEKLREACNMQTATVKSVETKKHTVKPPRLYDLTTLQRDANRIFGYTAQQTLDYAQSLYEKKLITYPRTDSQFLTSDMQKGLDAFAHTLTAIFPHAPEKGLAVNDTQVINDAKVSDHHAIMPTATLLKLNRTTMPTGECDILMLIINRMFCAMGNPMEYEEMTVTLECGGAEFKGKAKTLNDFGWKQIDSAYRYSLGNRAEQNPEDKYVSLPDLTVGQKLEPVMAALKEGDTTPPKHYTEDTLLAAMETAGSEDMPEDAERRGLGTPATRAGILEKLVDTKLINRAGEGKAKKLIPTEKGTALCAVLPESIQSPAMTAEWEQRLKEIEHGKADGPSFMKDIVTMLNDLILTSKPSGNYEDYFPSDKKRIGTCPACGAPVSENAKGYFCENRACHFALWKDNKFFMNKGKKMTTQLATAILKEGAVEMTGLYSEKTGKTYDATIALATDKDGSARFQMVFPNHRKDVTD